MKLATLLLLIFLIACSNQEKTKEGAADKTNSSSTRPSSSAAGRLSTNSEASILNNIVVHESGGLSVARVYLSFADGSLVSSANRVGVGQTVFLNLIIDKGWVTAGNLVSLDASERIETDDGRLVLNAPNLFKSMPQIEEEKAAHLFLKATITQTQPDIDHFLVNYHVWDKRGQGDVKGNYKLFVGVNELR